MFVRLFRRIRSKALNMLNDPLRKQRTCPKDILSVDIIGPYKIRREGFDEPLII